CARWGDYDGDLYYYAMDYW
nr:immunoglobulin heavy chain junction region [Mus musculus]